MIAFPDLLTEKFLFVLTRDGAPSFKSDQKHFQLISAINFLSFPKGTQPREPLRS